jgi:hypothetical protein
LNCKVARDGFICKAMLLLPLLYANRSLATQSSFLGYYHFRMVDSRCRQRDYSNYYRLVYSRSRFAYRKGERIQIRSITGERCSALAISIDLFVVRHLCSWIGVDLQQSTCSVNLIRKDEGIHPPTCSKTDSLVHVLYQC